MGAVRLKRSLWALRKKEEKTKKLKQLMIVSFLWGSRTRRFS
jgi:hypothetical protein